MKDIVKQDFQLSMVYSLKDFSRPFLLKDSVVHGMLSWKHCGYQIIHFDLFLNKFKSQQTKALPSSVGKKILF